MSLPITSLIKSCRHNTTFTPPTTTTTTFCLRGFCHKPNEESEKHAAQPALNSFQIAGGGGKGGRGGGGKGVFVFTAVLKSATYITKKLSLLSQRETVSMYIFWRVFWVFFLTVDSFCYMWAVNLIQNWWSPELPFHFHLIRQSDWVHIMAGGGFFFCLMADQ